MPIMDKAMEHELARLVIVSGQFLKGRDTVA